MKLGASFVSVATDPAFWIWKKVRRQVKLPQKIGTEIVTFKNRNRPIRTHLKQTAKIFQNPWLQNPVTSDGRRIWPPKFKKFVIDKIAKGEFKTKDIAKRCKVHPSVIQQWRGDIKTYASDEFSRDERHPPLEALGFIVPRMNNGRRIWPPELKTLAIEKLHAKEMSAVEIALACQVDSSVVYQWKLEIEKKARKKRRPDNTENFFAEVVKPDAPPAAPKSTAQEILIRLGDLEIALPADYPVEQVVALCKELAKPSHDPTHTKPENLCRDQARGFPQGHGRLGRDC